MNRFVFEYYRSELLFSSKYQGWLFTGKYWLQPYTNTTDTLNNSKPQTSKGKLHRNFQFYTHALGKRANGHELKMKLTLGSQLLSQSADSCQHSQPNNVKYRPRRAAANTTEENIPLLTNNILLWFFFYLRLM